MNEQRFDDINDIINNVVRKYSSKMYSRSAEDLAQDLWVKVLETEKEKGELDLKLIAYICHNYVKDLIDYDRRRNHFNIDLQGNDEDGEYADTDFLGIETDNGQYDSDIMVKDLFSKYPIGTKERMFLDFWGNATGVAPNNRAVPPEGREQDGFTEKNLAVMLGYASAQSGGYKKFRDRMKSIIKNHFES